MNPEVKIENVLSKIEEFVKKEYNNNLSLIFKNFSKNKMDLTYNEFKSLLSTLYIDVEEWEYQLIFDYVDTDKNNKIDLLEFYHLYFKRYYIQRLK